MRGEEGETIRKINNPRLQVSSAGGGVEREVV
jgi:hypothetical protein